MNAESGSEDAILVKEVLDGNKGSFAGLVNKYKKPVLNLCFRMTGNRHDAEDACQESFFRAYKNLRQYKPGLSFFTWLYTVALNTARNALKSRKPVSASLDKPIEFGDSSSKREVADTKPGADSVLEGEQAVFGMLKALPEKYRTPFVLRHLENYSIEEISGMLRMSPGAVKVRIHRARLMLYERFKDKI